VRSGILPGMRPRRGFLTWLVVLAVVGFAGRLVWIFAAVIPFVLFLGRRPRLGDTPGDIERPAVIVEA